MVGGLLQPTEQYEITEKIKQIVTAAFFRNQSKKCVFCGDDAEYGTLMGDTGHEAIQLALCDDCNEKMPL